MAMQFVFFDSFGNFLEETVGEDNYVRLNVPLVYGLDLEFLNHLV